MRLDAKQVKILKRTMLECWNVLRAKLGHDPYGMLLKDRPWREIVPITYRQHRDWLRRKWNP